MKRLPKLILAIAICQLAGIIGFVFTQDSTGTWYQTINKPTFTPPAEIFGPVWITLYTMMGISLFLVWNKKSRHKKKAITLFSIQLALNALWSILFFGLHAPWLAFANIILLWAFILAAMIQFYKISKPAAYLNLPYILWVSFAVVLNLAIALLN